MAPNNPWVSASSLLVQSFRLKAVFQLNQILPSEVLNALSNNDSPKQDVIRTVKVFRENPASLSSVIDKRIEDIDKQISALELEKSQLGSSESLRLAIEETYATICAPFRAIPRDILREIAHHSLDAHPSPARNHSPMSLTHVSSVWRSVVADSPSLWTTLYLRIQQANLDSLVKHLQVVQTWFHRAGSLPVQLFIYVDCTLGHKRNTAHNFRMFLKALAPWASRIRHLGIGGRHWVNLITKFVDIKWDLSDLVRLDFLGQMADYVPVCSRNEINELASICDKVTLFRTAKRLTTVVASQELSVHLQAFSFLPWSQVQHITLEEHEASGPEFLALMKQCPQLRTAALVWYQCGMSALGAPYAVKKMEKLQLFDVVVLSDFHEIAHFFSVASFPALTHLDISISEVMVEPDDFMSELDPISPFPSLQSFSLMNDTRLPIHLVLDFLRNMPRLRRFNMEISGSLDDEQRTDLNKLLESLTINEGCCEYLPLLEECSFLRSNKTELLDVTVAAQFIQSRTQALPPDFHSLKRLSLWGNFAFITDLWQEVVRCSHAEPPVEINIHSSASFYSEPSYCDPCGIRLTPFSNTNIVNDDSDEYVDAVNHLD